MSLNKNAKTFESDDSGMDGDDTATLVPPKASADERVAAATAKAAVAAADKPSTPEVSAERAVATAKPKAVALTIAQLDPFKPLENALKVDWNTLPRVMATNGGFQNKETQKMMGETIVLEVLSIQEHYVVSPGGDIDDEESRPFLKYSDDGITTREGESVVECVQRAIDAGYAKAARKHRCILVGALVDPGSKAPEMLDSLVQIDLAPNSFKNFSQHRFTTAYKVGKGKLPAEGAATVRLTGLVKTENKMNWTEATFESYMPNSK